MNVGKYFLFVFIIVDSYYCKRGNILLVFNIICILLRNWVVIYKERFCEVWFNMLLW